VECHIPAQHVYAIASKELRANRNTDFTEKFFVHVDVTEELPFRVTKLSPYYDR